MRGRLQGVDVEADDVEAERPYRHGIRGRARFEHRQRLAGVVAVAVVTAVEQRPRTERQGERQHGADRNRDEPARAATQRLGIALSRHPLKLTAGLAHEQETAEHERATEQREWARAGATGARQLGGGCDGRRRRRRGRGRGRRGRGGRRPLRRHG